MARFLRDEASHRENAIERDLFARSAFNRYYYATFLVTRSLLGELNNAWTAPPHASVPEILQGSVREHIKKAIRKARRVPDNKALAIFNKGTAAIRDLAETLVTANITRVVADYQPDIPIIFVTSSNYSLNNVSISTAHGWPERARGCTGNIKHAWELSDVI